MTHITLTTEDAATIRAALLTALRDRGGDLEEEYEPGLSPRTRAIEGELRAAIRVLDQAAPPTG